MCVYIYIYVCICVCIDIYIYIYISPRFGCRADSGSISSPIRCPNSCLIWCPIWRPTIGDFTGVREPAGVHCVRLAPPLDDEINIYIYIHTYL